MRALVTGADGFAGQWLVRTLLQAGDEVSGLSRAAHPALTTLEAKSALRARWFAADIRDRVAVGDAIRAAKPEAVYHLAGQASVKASFDDPLETFSTNVIGTATLLDAVKEHTPDAVVVAVGSAECYGPLDAAHLPAREDTPLAPTTPYAASKAAAETIALQYACGAGMHVVVTRSFNHTGPGQSTAFAAAAFAEQFAQIRNGMRQPLLEVGNLAPRRDFLDVRDVAVAYRALALRGTAGKVYNVCSGHAVSMREIAEDLMRISGVTPQIREDPARMRAVDTPEIVGDASSLRADTGWQPSIPWLQTLQDLYEWCLSRIA